MLSPEEIEAGLRVTHKNTGMPYTVAERGDEEVLLSPGRDGFEDLLVPFDLFLKEFVSADRYSGPRPRKGRTKVRSRTPAGPKVRGRIKKMVRDRGFGFIRGEDGKEVFFHRSGLSSGDYDVLNEGDAVEYVVQEGPRGARAEQVRTLGDAPGGASG